MLVFSAAERPGATSCRASRVWRCCRSRIRKSRYWSKVIVSLAGAGWGASCAAAGQCHQAAASSATAAAPSVHRLIVLSREISAYPGIEQNVIVFSKQFLAKPKILRARGCLRWALDEKPLALEPVVEVGDELAIAVPFEGRPPLVY